jgi:hypothetical protein
VATLRPSRPHVTATTQRPADLGMQVPDPVCRHTLGVPPRAELDPFGVEQHQPGVDAQRGGAGGEVQEARFAGAGLAGGEPVAVDEAVETRAGRCAFRLNHRAPSKAWKPVSTTSGA